MDIMVVTKHRRINNVRKPPTFKVSAFARNIIKELGVLLNIVPVDNVKF